MPKLSPPFRYGQVVIGRELMRVHAMRTHILILRAITAFFLVKVNKKFMVRFSLFSVYFCDKKKQKHSRMYSCTHITATMPHHSPVATACTAVAMETPASLVILWIGCNEQGFRGENSLTWWQVETVNWSTLLKKTLDSDFLRLSEHLV